MKATDLPIISSIFNHPLPGMNAHALMAKNLGRAKMVIPDDARKAAVMILLWPNDKGELEMVLTERAVTHNADTHSGQMSFPGGKYDTTDTDFKATALRETHEEVGVAPELIEVIGKLSTIYIPTSNFEVHPYLGYTRSRPEFIIEEREVAEVITVGLSFLLDYEVPSTTDITIRPELVLKDVPYFNIKEKVVWGATSMILNELLWAVRDRIKDQS